VVQHKVQHTDPHPDLTVDVRGFQWQWQFHYQGSDVVITGDPAQGPPVLMLPLDRTIRVNLVAVDVIHSFWVPDFLEKRDLIPGVDNHIDITPNAAGTFAGHCAEFCGLDHWRMGFEVTVVPGEQFDRWVADQKSSQPTPDASPSPTASLSTARSGP
jgi:cytochrome c oxidase subunit II